jgi:hypothetical protein
VGEGHWVIKYQVLFSADFPENFLVSFLFSSVMGQATEIAITAGTEKCVF